MQEDCHTVAGQKQTIRLNIFCLRNLNLITDTILHNVFIFFNLQLKRVNINKEYIHDDIQYIIVDVVVVAAVLVETVLLVPNGLDVLWIWTSDLSTACDRVQMFGFSLTNE